MSKKKSNVEYTDQDLSEADYMDDPSRRQERPHLMTRVGAAFFDLIIYVAMTIGLFLGCRAIFYGPMGYDSAKEFMVQRIEESHLFIREGQFYYTISERYDDSKDVIGNYHDAIVYYLSNCEYPAGEHKLNDYYEYLDDNPNWVKKVSEGEYVIADGVLEADAKTWFAGVYNRVCDYLYNEPDFVRMGNKRTIVTYYNVLIAQVIAGGIYYIALPLFLPHGATFFKWVFKMGIEDKRTRGDAPKGRLILRQSVLVFYNFLIPVFMYFFINRVGWIGILLVLLNALLISLTPSFSGIEDFAGRTGVISLRVKNIM